MKMSLLNSTVQLVCIAAPPVHCRGQDLKHLAILYSEWTIFVTLGEGHASGCSEVNVQWKLASGCHGDRGVGDNLHQAFTLDSKLLKKGNSGDCWSSQKHLNRN